MSANYPIRRPASDSDSRFTFGLVMDVGKLLAERGYPPLDGASYVRLQQALFGFIYEPAEVPE